MKQKYFFLGTLLLIPSVSAAQSTENSSFPCPASGLSGSSEVSSSSSTTTAAVTLALSQGTSAAVKICSDKIKHSTTYIESYDVDVSAPAPAAGARQTYKAAGQLGFCCYPPKPTPTPEPTRTPLPIDPKPTPKPTDKPTPVPTASPLPTQTPVASEITILFHVFHLAETAYVGDFFILPQAAAVGSAGTEYHSANGEVSVTLAPGEYKIEFRQLKLTDAGVPNGYSYSDYNFIVSAGRSPNYTIMLGY